MIKFCPFRRRNAIKSQITTHPIKAAGTAAFIGCFLLFRERTGCPAERPRRASPPDDTGRLPGSRNEMLSPRKGTLWPLHGLETDFRHPRTNIIFYLYIPQFLPRGLRAFLFDTFLFYSQTYYKRIHDFHYGRACHCAGALFLRLNAPALQRAWAAAPVLKLFKQISRLEGI